MTTQKELETFKKNAEKVTKEVIASKSAARKLLYGTGMYEKNGKLKKQFRVNNLKGKSHLMAAIDDADFSKEGRK